MKKFISWLGSSNITTTDFSCDLNIFGSKFIAFAFEDFRNEQ